MFWKFIRRYRGLIIRSWRRWWREAKIRNFVYEIWRQKWENWDRSSGCESLGIKWCWERTRSLLSVESKRTRVREETNAVSGTTVMSGRNQHQKPLHPLSHQPTKRGRSASRKGTSEAGVRLGRSIDSRAETSWKVFALNYPVTIGILPNVSFISQNRDVISAISARFRTERLRNNQIKSRQKCSGYGEKTCERLGCALQDTEPPQSSSILRKATRVLGPIRRVRFTRATLIHAKLREKKGPSLNILQVKLPRQRSPCALKFEDRSQEEWKTRAMRPWRLAKNIHKLKETDETTFFSLTNEWSLPVPSTTKSEEREFVVDSGVSMHMVSRKDLNSAELETVKVC